MDSRDPSLRRLEPTKSSYRHNDAVSRWDTEFPEVTDVDAELGDLAEIREDILKEGTKAMKVLHAHGRTWVNLESALMESHMMANLEAICNCLPDSLEGAHRYIRSRGIEITGVE